MAVPKRRQSNTRTNKRRTHDSLNSINMSECSHCHSAVLPHRVCPYCGYYDGRSVVPIVEKAKKEK